MLGFPIVYRTAETSPRHPAELTGMVTGGGTSGTEGSTGPDFSLVVFPPNAPMEHIDVATVGFGPGQFHVAGQEEEPKPKRAPRPKPAEAQAEATAGQALITSGPAGAPIIDPPSAAPSA